MVTFKQVSYNLYQYVYNPGITQLINNDPKQEDFSLEFLNYYGCNGSLKLPKSS